MLTVACFVVVFRRKTIVEPIEVALMASLSHLSVSVCSHKRDLAEIEVIGRLND